MVIPSSVTRVGNNAFSNCAGLKEVVITSNKTEFDSSSVDTRAFYGSKNIETLMLPTGLQMNEFDPLTKIKNLNITAAVDSGSVSVIPGGITAVDNVFFSEGITQIDSICTDETDKLRDCTYFLPKSVTAIGENSFQYATKPIYVYKNSYAHTYAQKNNIPFLLIDETVTVAVTPHNASVQRGKTEQFRASVDKGVSAVDQSVIWAVSGGGEGTTISSEGLLVVALNEPAIELDVTATSVAFPDKATTVKVTLHNEIIIPPVKIPKELVYMALSQAAYTDFGAADIGVALNDIETFNEENNTFIQGVSIGSFIRKYAGNWTLIFVYDQNYHDDVSGYYGVAFINEDKTEVVISSRGTENVDDYLEDFAFGAAGFLGTQFSDAEKLYQYIAASGYSTAKITTTGHSLGGALGTYLANRHALEGSIVFNAPSATFVAYVTEPQEMGESFRGIDYNYVTDYVNEWCLIGNCGVGDNIISGAAQFALYLASLGISWIPGSIVSTPYDMGIIATGGSIDNTVLCNDNAKTNGMQARNSAWGTHELGALLHIDPNTKKLAIDEQRPLQQKKPYNSEGANLFQRLFLGTTSVDSLYDNLTNLTSSSVFYGGDGNDTLVQSGLRILANHFVGGVGNDYIVGGLDKDYYYYQNGDGVDTIWDLSGNETLYLNGFSKQDIITFDGESDAAFILINNNGQNIIKISKNRVGNPFNSFEVVANGKSTKLQDWNQWAKLTQVIAKCPVTMEVYDNDGVLVQTLGNDKTESFYTDYGYFHIVPEEGISNFIKIAYLNDDSYTIKLRGTDTGTMDYSIGTLNEAGTMDTYTSDSVPITPTTVITTSASTETAPQLLIDSDGDGAADKTVDLIMKEAPTITDILITPLTTTVQNGTTQQFSATVNGTNSPSQGVTWSVNSIKGSAISSNGLLSVAAGETAATLTVTATSTFDATKSGTVTVTVTSAPVVRHMLIVNGGTGSGSYASGASVSVVANAAPKNQQFKQWTATGLVNATYVTNPLIFTMPAEAVMLTAVYEDIPLSSYTVTFEPNGGTRTGGGELIQMIAKGGTATAPIVSRSGHTFTRWDKAYTNVTANMTVTAVWQQDGTGDGGASSSGNTTTQTAKGSYTVSGEIVAVSRSDIQSLANGGKSLTIKSDKATMTFDSIALKTILDATSNTVTFGIAPADISKFVSAQALIGNRPVFNFTIAEQLGGKNVTVPIDFGSGRVSVEIKYTPTTTELNDGLYVVYVDSKGNTTPVAQCNYNGSKKTMIFSADHFSTYGVAYKTDVPKFDDIATHWAKGDMEFVINHSLMSGTGDGKFSPDIAMSRGMFVTVLGRLAVVDTSSYKTSNFTDLKADTYYTTFVNWAVAKNIVSGTSATTFAPDKSISRQELAVILTNYAKVMGYTVPQTYTAVTFADNSNIASWAAEAVKVMQMAGVLMGKDGNQFDPTGTATRAEVSAVLHRYVMLVVDKSTEA